MNRSVAILIGIVLVIGIAFAGMYNGLVRKQVAVDSAWAQVENVLQRRADLIPNLVSTVKGFAKHEKGILAKLAEARTQYAGAKSTDEKAKAGSVLEGAIGRILLIMENYPNLKANESFNKLMDELSGTENRIAVERMRYNEAVQNFNTTIRRVPYNFMAGFMGFTAKNFFEAAPEAKAAPKVSFE